MKKIEELLQMSEDDLYSHYSEGSPRAASQAVRDASNDHNMALDEYIAAVSVNSFANGFLYAVSLMREGNLKA